MTALPGLLWPIARAYWSVAALLIVSGLAWHFDARAVANADAMRVQAAAFRQAQATATIVAQQALQHQQAEYAAKSTEAQNAYQSQLAQARGATDQYILAHRMQPAPPEGRAVATAAPTQGDGAVVPAKLPIDAVVVSTGDVQACTNAVTYALSAHDWASSINP